ncbi:MAG: conjugal transfer protein TraF [bacterium]
MSRACLTLAFLLTVSTAAGAQPFETLGVRALGMGGAFVAVADDATAVWWNPAGLATGGIFSLAIEHESLDERSGSGIITGTPPLGLSYIRTRLDGLVTHQAGVTVLYTLVEGFTVGSTLKFVRGLATVGPDDAPGRATNSFDLDAGALYVRGPWRAGLTVRNIAEPEFETVAGIPLRLERMTRAGAAWLEGNWTVSVDLDLTASAVAPRAGTAEERRMLAAGTEWRWGRRLAARGGFRLNTAGDERAPVATGGFGIAVWGSVWMDAQVTGGGEVGDRGWGLAGRVHF